MRVHAINKNSVLYHDIKRYCINGHRLSNFNGFTFVLYVYVLIFNVLECN